MGILRTDKLSGIGTDGPVFDGVTRFDTQGYFVPPPGTTDQRSAGITTTQGAIRFNTDSQKLEFYAQDQWWEMVIDTPALGTSSDTGAGARGLFGGGAPGAGINTIEYVNISSTGNAQDFGDLTVARRDLAALSSSIRGCWIGGIVSVATNVIDYITISSTGNALDFGDLIQPGRGKSGCSNSTRGVFSGGNNDSSPLINYNVIEYLTISSTGNTQDFGDLIISASNRSSCSSPTRGLFGGGSSPTNINAIEYVTISTLGNAQDFGDLTAAKFASGGCSNSTRGLFGGGGVGATSINTIDYITISTLGNSVKFGDLTLGRFSYSNSWASPTRGGWAGGYYYSPTLLTSNIIDYVTILTQGNAIDFGDLLTDMRQSAGCSNAHGGL